MNPSQHSQPVSTSFRDAGRRGLGKSPGGYAESSSSRQYRDNRSPYLLEGVHLNHYADNLMMRVLLPKELVLNQFQHQTIQNRNLITEELSCSKLDGTAPDLSISLDANSTKREKVLNLIRSVLPHHTLKIDQIKIKHDEELLEPETSSKDIKLTPAASLYYPQICSSFNESSSLYYYCQASKDLNLAFQQFIMNLSQSQLALIRNKGKTEFDVLVVNKHGNYLIQRIIQIDRQFSDFAVKACMANFQAYASNEYSSRVMQLLIAERADFRAFVHRSFQQDIYFACSRLTATFLLMIAIRHATDANDYAYVHTALVNDASLANTALFKRVLISYFQFANSTMISETWIALRKIGNFEHFFDKKFNSLLILMIIKRGFEPALSDIFGQISAKFCGLIDRKCFKLVIEKLLQVKYSSCRHQMNEALTSISFFDLLSLRRRSVDNFNYYLFVTVASFSPDEPDRLNNFLEKITNAFPKEMAALLASPYGHSKIDFKDL